jgi:hypothetical protein
LSGPDEAALPDQTIEDGERFGAIESGRGANVAVADWSGLGKLGDDVGEFVGGEPQTGGRSDHPTESVGRAPAAAVLFQEPLVAKSVEYLAGCVRLDCGELANTFVGERCPASGMHVSKASGRVKQAGKIIS